MVLGEFLDFSGNLGIVGNFKKAKGSFKSGLGKFIMLVSNDLFRHDEVGLGK